MGSKHWYLFIVILGVFGCLAGPAQAAASPAVPDVAFIEGFVAHGQTYPLSCESRSAVDLAAYWGVQIGEIDFFNSLPVSDNPEKGFVGSVQGVWGQTPPKPYGVHAKPVAKLLQSYGLAATARRGMTIKDLKTEIANGRPVIVWVVGHVWQGTSKDYVAKDGNTVLVAPYEHTMIAYGYDLAGVYLIDAGNAARNGYSYSVFKSSWGVLGNMAVTAEGAVETVVKIQVTTGNASGHYVVQRGDYLSQLARQWGYTWQELADLNGITWPYTIYPGQILVTGLETPEGTKEPIKTSVPTEATETPVPSGSSAGSSAPGKVVSEGGSQPTLETYTVEKGEHLMQISRKLQLSWTAIADLNQLSPPYALVPGQVLTLPGSEAGPPPPPISGSTSGTTGGSGSVYSVQQGEYLYMIAKKVGVNWHELADLNKIGAPYLVYPGQELILP